MAKLETLSQTTMDLYFQQYKSDEDFFEYSHFVYLCAAAYAQILQEEYEKSYMLNLREKQIGEANLNPEWFIEEEKEVTTSETGDRELTLASCPFSFRFDKQSSGVQGVYPLAGKCGEFIRIGVDDLWKIKNAPTTNIVFWYVVANKIVFKNVHCGLKKVKVTYIPSLKELEDQCSIADSMQMDVINRVLNVMFVARQGGVVDVTNNQNPNKVLETEIDTVFKNIKTNP